MDICNIKHILLSMKQAFRLLLNYCYNKLTLQYIIKQMLNHTLYET